MKYSLIYTPMWAWRQIYYAFTYNKLSGYLSAFFLALTLPAVAILSAVDADMKVNYWLISAPYIFLGLLTLGYVAVYRINKRQFANAEGELVYDLELSEDAIRMRAGGKTLDMTFEKSGMKSSKLFTHGVYVKHKKTDFMVPLPEDKKDKIVTCLRQTGWLEDRA